MKNVAEFSKVPYEQFREDMELCGFLTDEIDDAYPLELWNRIKLPERATVGSCGYDFYSPFSFTLRPGWQKTIPTGIRIKMDPEWLLMLVPRSGLGFKFGFKLVNTCGIIDQSYYDAENYGHIMAKVSSESNMFLQEGDRFIQGILLPYATATNEVVPEKERTGGMGSTGLK